jgi:hypothetical protein
LEQLRRIVQFRLDARLTDSASQLISNLVGSLVELGVVRPDESEALSNAVLQLVSIPVTIDIKPGSFPNSINPGSNGNIPVAILSTPTFNAAASVDRTSLTFGRTGNEQSLLRSSVEDTNSDGLPDVICQFDTRKAGFQSGDTQGILKGRTIGGVPIVGSDSVRIVP